MASSLKRVADFASDRINFKGRGKIGTATAGQTSNIDLKLTEPRLLNGVQIILTNHTDADYAKLQVVDVDNLLGYGANTVISTYADEWYFASDTQNQGLFKLEYVADIPSGFYLRIAYISTGNTDVTVRANYFLHKALV
jgi:hypothetical protein